MTHITCRLTAKNRDQLRIPTLGNRVLAIFLNSCLSHLFKDFWLTTGSRKNACGVLESPGKVLEFFVTPREWERWLAVVVGGGFKQ